MSEAAGPRLEKNTIIETSAFPFASFVRFTEGSGYTQFSGYWTTVISEYHITKALFGLREDADWPDQDERTVLVTVDDEPPPLSKRFIEKNVPIPKPKDVPEGFDDDLEKRLEAAAAKQAASPFLPNKKPTTNGQQPEKQPEVKQQDQKP